jgi:hypothetical protein
MRPIHQGLAFRPGVRVRFVGPDRYNERTASQTWEDHRNGPFDATGTLIDLSLIPGNGRWSLLILADDGQLRRRDYASVRPLFKDEGAA